MLSPVDLLLSDAIITHLLSLRFSRPSYSKLRCKRNLGIGNILTKTNLVLLDLLGATEGKKNRSFTTKRVTDSHPLRVNIQSVICSSCLMTRNCN